MADRKDDESKQDADEALRKAAADVSKAVAVVALPRNAPNIEPPTLELTASPQAESRRSLPPPKPAASAAAGDAAGAEAAETIERNAEPSSGNGENRRRSMRFVLLAASVATAAVIGSLAGSLATSGLTGMMGKSTSASEAATTRALKQTVAQLGADVTSLKASVDAVNRTNTTQYAHISERFDRIEHAQSDPSAKLAKIAEQLDRLEHRAAAPAPDVTGSIGENRAAAAAASPAPAAPPIPAAPEAKLAKPPILDGWILRGVYRGRALIESRYGEYEVVPGSNLPGLGTVEDVVRQDGRWVVVTPRGLITSMR